MFDKRSDKKEMLDETGIPKELLYVNLKELEFINKHLGGHSVSLCGIKKVITDQMRTYNVVDIGCGGGDSIKAIYKWTKNKNYSVHLTGIDLKQECIDYSKTNCHSLENISLCCEDFRIFFEKEQHIDIVHASLFCHHFSEEELISFIQLCIKKKIIFVINDLERNPIAYYAIKLLTKLFSNSILVKNDAPLSVLRGFKKIEWKTILEKAGAMNYTLENKWAFRHLLVIYPDGK